MFALYWRLRGRRQFAAQDVPIADAKPEEIQDLLGGALFRALYKWMVDTGPVYLLPTGEKRSPRTCCKSIALVMMLKMSLTVAPKGCSRSANGSPHRPRYTSAMRSTRNGVVRRMAGPASSFLVISDPAAAKHVLRATDNPNNPLYNKGLVAEVTREPCAHRCETLTTQ